MSPVLIELSGSAAEVVLNRPQRRIAPSGVSRPQLADIFAAVDRGSEIAAVSARGVDGFFCSALDLEDIDISTSPTDRWLGVHQALVGIAAPVIGVVTGAAINAGAALASACDLLIVGRHSFCRWKRRSLA